MVPNSKHYLLCHSVVFSSAETRAILYHFMLFLVNLSQMFCPVSYCRSSVQSYVSSYMLFQTHTRNRLMALCP